MQPIEYSAYYPGMIGDIISLHGSYYAEHHGFDLSFEALEARELAEFAEAYDPGRDFWQAARCSGRFAGSIVIDGRIKDELGVRLRWFIVDPEARCHGIGSRLLHDALQFSRDAGYARIHLRTVKGLEAARRLYLKAGFELRTDYEVEQWGITLVEQIYVMDL